MSIVKFLSLKSARLRLKVEESKISHFEPSGRPIYSKRPIYAHFREGLLTLDTEKEDDKKMIEALRKDPKKGSLFKEVGAKDEKAAPKLAIKFSDEELASMNKSTLLKIAHQLAIKADEKLDTKEMLVRAISTKQNTYADK